VRHDLYIEEDGVRRLKTCREHYSKFVSEMWFSVREIVEGDQAREFNRDVLFEFTMRNYSIVKGNKTEVEPKDDMKERLTFSPDLADSCAVAVEGAPGRGSNRERRGRLLFAGGRKIPGRHQKRPFNTRMSWTLKSFTTCPPGEFRYQQTSPLGKLMKFGPDPDIHHLANVIADWRRANGMGGATHDQAMVDIVEYTCQRLGNHPNWCYNTDKTVAQVVPVRRHGCSSCGSRAG
jgi:hypothetical protein